MLLEDPLRLPEVASFQELNALLWERCLSEVARRLRGETATIGEMWELERPHLLPLPLRPFPCCRTVPVLPNRFSLVTFETNRYSVPVTDTHGRLLLRAFVDCVEITDGDQVVATHPRSYGREEDVLDLMHYLPLLRQRPGALDYAKPFKLWSRPAVMDRYHDALRERLPERAATSQLLDVLELASTYSMDAVAIAVERAMTTGSLGSETVAYFLRTGNLTQQFVPHVLSAAPPCPMVQDRDLRQYDRLIRR